MEAIYPRILFAAPDESFIINLNRALPRGRHNVLAVNALEEPLEQLVENARASSIEVIISRGGTAERLRGLQRGTIGAIPVVEIEVSFFDIVEAIREAGRVSNRIAFVAWSGLLDHIRRVSDFLNLEGTIIYRSSPLDCLESIFKALENQAEVIVGDSRVNKICRDNGVPSVLLAPTDESIRQAYQSALEIIRIRDDARVESRRLGRVLDSLEHGILAVDMQGKILYGNDQAATVLSLPRTRLRDQPLQALPGAGEALTSLADNQDAAFPLTTDTGTYDCSWQVLNDASLSIRGLLHVRARKNPGPGRPVSKELGHHARYSLASLVGTSPSLQLCKARAKKFANADATVLLLGPTGSGKELFAHAIHEAGKRAHRPFVPVNLAALPPSLMESELFGYVRGAFTDARKTGRRGVFDSAEQGTVFLDEIGEMPLAMQSRLLRILQDGEFSRLGDDRLVHSRCRIIAATNRDLRELVRQGQFREDLFYRLNILVLNIPPLEERKEDIPGLCRYFLDKFCCQYQKTSGIISEEAMGALLRHDWPGNVRELQAVIERTVLICDDTRVNISPDLLAETMAHDDIQGAPVDTDPLSDERILQVLAQCHYHKGRAALRLGIHRATLWRRLQHLNQGKS